MSRLLLIVAVLIGGVLGILFQKYVTVGRIARYLNATATADSALERPAYPGLVIEVSAIEGISNLSYPNSNIGIVTRGNSSSADEIQELILPATRNREVMPACHIRVGDRISGDAHPLQEASPEIRSMAAFRDNESYSMPAYFVPTFELSSSRPTAVMDPKSYQLFNLPLPVLKAPKADWWFYSKAAIYAPNFWEKTSQLSAIDVISEFAKQLENRGKTLLFVTVPQSLSIYPEIATGDESFTPTPGNRANVYVADFHKKLVSEGVNTLDLTSHFLENRYINVDGQEYPAWCKTDGHFNSLGADLAAKKVWEQLLAHGCQVGGIQGMERTFALEPYGGNIGELRESRGLGIKIPDELLPMLRVRQEDGSGLSWENPEASIHIIGDSFSRYFGEASFRSHLAYYSNQFVNSIHRDGGAMNSARLAFQQNEAFLENAEFVVWMTVEYNLAQSIAPNTQP